ncbi:MAG: radical SAM protein [Byssovorax sp.]
MASARDSFATAQELRGSATATVTWSRSEPFGAWIRLGDETLLAVDHTLAGRLGIPRTEATHATRPLELHIAVTSRCPAPCEGCYLDARPDGDAPPLSTIVERLHEAREAGVSTVAFGGGEPLTRDDLGAIAAEARRLGLVPVLTTSGIGLREEQVPALRAFAQINVSHDGAGEAYEKVRGFDGRAAAERAIRMLSAAGIPTGVNVVITRDTFDTLDSTVTHLATLGAGEIQLLRYKPGGRAAGPGYADRRLLPAQAAALFPAIARIVERRLLKVRIDCAMVPLLGGSLLAAGHGASALEAFGLFGCEAARHLGGMRVDGSPAPCSFFAAPPALASLHGHGAEPPPRRLPLASAWDVDPDLAAFRAYHAALPEPCRSCPLASVCRGGCQVVSRHASGGAFGPDPECPRVLAHRGQGA